jgi:cell division septation protein DedD
MKNFKMLLFGSAIILVTVACGTVQINTGSNEPTQAPAQPTQAPEQAAEPAPGGWRDDVPIPDGVTNLVSTDDKATCNTTDDLQTTADFYRSEMPKYGWSLDSDTSTPIAVNLFYTKDGEMAHIGLTGSANGALIMIIVSPQSPDEPVKATAEPVEPTIKSSEPTTKPVEPTTKPAEPTAEPTDAPESPPAPGGWRDDVPIPADASHIVWDADQITFDTAGSVQITADFYKTEMPKYGWALTSETSTSFAVSLIFTKGDEEAVVDLAALGAVTSGTRVGIVID